MEPEKLSVNERHLEDITKADGWVYYIEKEKAFDSSGVLYKSREDGSEKTKVCNDEAAHLHVADGWLYYRSWSDGGAFYKIRPDGRKKTKIMDDFFSELFIDGDWIYYSGGRQGRDSDKLWKIRTDGSGRENFNKFECDDPKLQSREMMGRKVETFMLRQIQSVSDGWVYYTQRLYEPEIRYFDGVSPHSTYHCKIRTDGTDKQIIREVRNGEHRRGSAQKSGTQGRCRNGNPPLRAGRRLS